RILQYFTALCRLGDYPPVRCNAPEFSAVVAATGRVQPCFFIEGPPASQVSLAPNDSLSAALNTDAMLQLRTDIREGRRAECPTCVCSLWRHLPPPQHLATTRYGPATSASVPKFSPASTAL